MGSVSFGEGLGVRGQELWDAVTAEHDLDGVQLTLLEAACHQADVLGRSASLAPRVMCGRAVRSV